jgi:ubiquinol-cytochrome c reductase cytochrome b subunit
MTDAVPPRRRRTKEPLPAKATRAAVDYVDDRFTGSRWIRATLNKVFPDHWSFMIGEIALYSFVILLLTGTFLTLFFDSSVERVVYQGTYVPLRGVEMTRAYESTLHITFDVRGGLLIRQIHHWAALIFMSSIVVHCCRIFFTGAFRRPREINWVIGVLLMILGILEGFAGYSLPDDLLSGTGLRIAFSIVEAVPVVGPWAGFLLFGGNFPGEGFIPRLYAVHILLLPGVLLGLISAHMMILWHQKHTDFPGPGKTEHTVVGTRIWPGFALKTGGFFMIVFAVLALLGGFAQINPVWLYGPYNPAHVSAGSQPDWYMGFLDGALRLMPNWETNLLGHTLSWNLLIPALVLPGLIFTPMIFYPWLEAWVTKDHAHHNLLDRPRNRPGRTGLGMMSLSFYFILLLGSSTDVLAVTFDLSFNFLIRLFQVLLFVVPPVVYYVTRRICLALQRKDQEEAHHGVETGTIVRAPSGEYTEIHAPLPTPKVPELVAVGGPDSGAASQDTADGQRNGGLLGRARRAVGGFFYEEEHDEPQRVDPDRPVRH